MTKRLIANFRILIAFITCTLIFPLPPISFAGAADGTSGLISWQDWTPDLFDEAQKQQRFVILDLEAVWCHWCHVMDTETYSNPNIADLINKHYIAVRIDQDAHPDISNRYGDYGWPATIVFAPNGSEIVKRRGYIPAGNMVSMLQEIIDDPSPGPSIIAQPEVKPSPETSLDAEQRNQLTDMLFDVYDAEHGGWGTIHKFIQADAIEYALLQAQRGERLYSVIAKQTLSAGTNLVDPVWGGVYQYSDEVDWLSPHYEKIISTQATNLRAYSMAYALWKNPEYLKTAQSGYNYLTEFLRDSSGGFYTSQDADLNSKINGEKYYALNNEARRTFGEPRIDRHIYSRENGWAIRALTNFYDATGTGDALVKVKQAADFILAHRRLKDGGFSHDGQDRAGPYLADNLSMAQAMLSLYRSTADRKWLDETTKTLDYIGKNFVADDGGFATSLSRESNAGVFTKPVILVEENTELTRLFNLAFRYTASMQYRKLAEHGMRYLTSPVLLKGEQFFPGLLLADLEMAEAPVHITIVGAKDDAAAQSLYSAALAYPVFYKRQEWWDKQQGELPNPDIEYPNVQHAAAFACGRNTCSLPVYKPADIAAAVDRINTPE